MILIIDNYDSFTYNLKHYILEVQTGVDVQVFRNDKISLDEIAELKPTHIVVSPGPCTPNEAGISLDVIKRFGGEVPILGVCLGHQSIGAVYGANIIRADEPVHGKTSVINVDTESKLFNGLDKSFEVTRYHSLIIERESLPNDEFNITAEVDGIIMAIEHKDKPIYGVQFHPESIASQNGHEILKNFLS